MCIRDSTHTHTHTLPVITMCVLFMNSVCIWNVTKFICLLQILYHAIRDCTHPSIAHFIFFAFSKTVSAKIGWLRIITQPFSHNYTTTTSARTLGPFTPLTPFTINSWWSFTHCHTAPFITPLKKSIHNTTTIMQIQLHMKQIKLLYMHSMRQNSLFYNCLLYTSRCV